MLTLQERIEKLLSKSEAMVLLCSKTSGYWSMIKFAFNIPLVLTSSAMCIINSISEDANVVKVPNIVVNAISVLIMSHAPAGHTEESLCVEEPRSKAYLPSAVVGTSTAIFDSHLGSSMQAVL